MIVAGLGCRKGTSAKALLTALDAACDAAGISRESIAALATGEIKHGEPGLVDLAEKLALPLQILDGARLKSAQSRTKTVSARSLAQTGSPSLSEAAALAGAGEGSVLIVSRLIAGSATCALARSRE